MSDPMPFGSEAVELQADGNEIVADCLACHPPHEIGRWDVVSLDVVITALYSHQQQVTSPVKLI